MLGLWGTRAAAYYLLCLQHLETSCHSLMQFWLLHATRSRKQRQLITHSLIEGYCQRRIYAQDQTKKTTSASKVHRFHGLPGPKSGLRALIILAQATILTEGVRVPVSAGMGGPKPTGPRDKRLEGKYAPGGLTMPVMHAAGVMANTGHKRSFTRAQRRSMQNPNGYTNYRGQQIHGSQLGLHTAIRRHEPQRKRRPACKHRGGAAQRLRILSINVNSLSGFLWGEIKTFLKTEGAQSDFIFLQETHRTSSSIFQVDKP